MNQKKAYQYRASTSAITNPYHLPEIMENRLI